MKNQVKMMQVIIIEKKAEVQVNDNESVNMVSKIIYVLSRLYLFIIIF